MKYRLMWAGLAVVVMFGAGTAASSYCGSFAWAGTCQDACHRAFAQCYNSSGGDRSTCAAKRAQCLSACLN